MRCLSTNLKGVVDTTHCRLLPLIMYCIVVLAFTENFRYYVMLLWEKNAEVAGIKLYDEIATMSQQ